MREVAGAAPSGKCLSSRTPHRWHRPCIFRRREIRREGHRGHARVQRGPHPSDDVRGAAQGRRQHGDPRGRRLDRRDARDRPAARAGDLRPQPELRLRRQPEDLLRGSAPRRSRRRRHGPPRLSVRPAARPSDHRADPPRRGRRGAGSRLKTGSALRQGMPWWKYVSNRFLTALENRAFRLRLSEFHTGYRAFRREVLERVNFVLNSDGFVFDQEIIAQVVAARFRIAEIAVPTRYFPEASSASFWASITYGLSTLVLLARYALPRRDLLRPRRFDSLRGRYTRLAPPERVAARARS